MTAPPAVPGSDLDGAARWFYGGSPPSYQLTDDCPGSRGVAQAPEPGCTCVPTPAQARPAMLARATPAGW